MPDYIGPATPAQLVKIRLGRLSRYASEGAGYQSWDQAHYPCLARVGTPGSNPLHYFQPWQANWIPTTAYVTVPNVKEVKQDKKIDVGGIGTATIQIENIEYPDAGGYHVRERGHFSPLRGYYAHGDEEAPDLPQLLDEIGAIVAANEWQGRFSYAAQVTIYQGYGTELAKTFTGLIEDLDSTSRPDRIVLTARDFGQIFTDEHIFGWGKDPLINTPVVFVDKEEASNHTFVAYNANASSEDGSTHAPSAAIDNDKTSFWRSQFHTTAANTEWIEFAIKEGAYLDFDLLTKLAGMGMYVSLRPAVTAKGDAPSRNGVPLTIENKNLDAEGWVDLGHIKSEEAKEVPGTGTKYINHVTGLAGNSYDRHFLDVTEGEYIVGDNTIVRLSFRNLGAVGGGFRAEVTEVFARRLVLETAGAREQWVTTEDAADVIRILCQWAGFKEWDIPDTGFRLPVRILAHQNESYLDVIKRIVEGFGNSYVFYMADPAPDSAPRGEESLGIPTFRKTRVTANDLGGLPTITDRSLLTAIQMKQTNEPLAYVIRVYGLTKTAIGSVKAGIESGKRLVYTLRPPWTGTPPHYDDSRLAGVLKHVVLHNNLFSTPELVRNAAFYIALQQALESIQATIEFPAFPGLELDDHALLMDLGTGLTTRIAVASRSSTFTDGEKRKFAMSITGPLIDTPDIRDMVNIINGVTEANGVDKEWGNPVTGVGSSLGYG